MVSESRRVPGSRTAPQRHVRWYSDVEGMVGYEINEDPTGKVCVVDGCGTGWEDWEGLTFEGAMRLPNMR